MKTLKFKNTNGVTFTYEQASVFQRITSFIIDFIIYFLVFIALYSITIAITKSAIAMLFLYFIYALTPLLVEILTNGQSPGKKMLGIAVISNYGQHCTIVAYFTRYIIKLAEVGISFGLLPILSIIFSERGQSISDIFAGTAVVVVKNNLRFSLSEIVNIGTLQSQEITFPEVRRLREKDVIMLKTLLYEDLKNSNKIKLMDQAAQKISNLLGIDKENKTSQEFLNTVITDYIIATR